MKSGIAVERNPPILKACDGNALAQLPFEKIVVQLVFRREGFQINVAQSLKNFLILL